jgi:hypothetical protein
MHDAAHPLRNYGIARSKRTTAQNMLQATGRLRCRRFCAERVASRDEKPSRLAEQRTANIDQS